MVAADSTAREFHATDKPCPRCAAAGMTNAGGNTPTLVRNAVTGEEVCEVHDGMTAAIDRAAAQLEA